MPIEIFATLGFCIALCLLGLRWMKKRCIIRRIKQEREKKEISMALMEILIEKIKKQNPGEDFKRILEMSLVELTEKLRDGTLSPEGVLGAYISKALKVNEELNCVTHFMTDCETQLEKLKHQTQKGLLYGVPVSIKEHINYKGHPSTCGLLQYINDIEKEDSVIVKVLKKQGAIVFAKTNVSQSLISYESSNSIYGQTLNPHNQNKSAGGSSSGEGALIGAGGSILGIGTDIGGSIRLPSSFCGIAGFKSTPHRLSTHGMRKSVDGLLSVLNCTGPMARDVDSLVLCLRALLCEEMFNLDPTVPPLPFNEELFSAQSPLRIGYYDTDYYFLPNPGMRRVLLETKKLLENAGHTLIPFTPPQIEYVTNELFVKALLGDGAETMREKFKENIVDPNLKDQFNFYHVPRFLKKIWSLVLHPLHPRIARNIDASRGARCVKDHWKHQTAVEDYKTEFISQWRRLNLDVILCPMLSPAFNIGYAGKLLAGVSYTMLYNVVGFPAGVVPVGITTKTDEEDLRHYKGHWNDPWDILYRKAVEDGIGLPLSVQCVALPYQDELCLRFMKEIESLYRLNQKKKREA